MSKKRAFVRYTKSGEIVPGSLIITTNGGYPDKSSLWQEVTVDQCCDTGGDCTPLEAIGVADVAQENLFSATFNGVNIVITCRDVLSDFPYSVVVFINQIGDLSSFSFSNWSDVINYLNITYASIGTFTYLGGTSVQLTTNTEYIPCIDPEVEIEFSTPAAALPSSYQIKLN